MSTLSDATLRSILQTVKTIAGVGASDKKQRPVYGVMQFLQQPAYRCIPVNPRLAGEQLLGEMVYANLTDITEPVDMVDVFRRSEEVQPIADAAIEIGAKVLWMQLDVVTQATADHATSAGLKVVMNRCPAIEIPRLGI